MTLEIGVVSPQDWGLTVIDTPADLLIDGIGIHLSEIENRAKSATYDWLLRQFDEEVGAFHGFYRATDQFLDVPQTVNLIAPWQMIAAFDRYQDEQLLEVAERAAEWFYQNHVVDHPMSFVAGGVRDGIETEHIWTKFVGEEVLTCTALFTRTHHQFWLDRAQQCGRYLRQARRHKYAPRFNLTSGRWMELGWDSWGRAVEANLLLWTTTQEQSWLDEAVYWGQHGCDIQAENGAFYLIDGEYFNTDLAADELRALIFLYEAAGDKKYLEHAISFADWLLTHQLDNGAWPLTIDHDGYVIMPTVGPGDVPNIGIAFLRLYDVTQERRYIESFYQTIKYTLQVQITPDNGHPYHDDERARWGFWSWQPHYDYTVSGDQSTHHTRGMWFLIDYWMAYLRD